jgi:hypothetical protein
MLYFLLAIVVLIPIAMVGGLIYAYKKLPRNLFVLLVALAMGAPYVAFKLHEQKFMLEAIPDALSVSSIAYREEESWGFGPGGNEAGIRLYPLPENISRTIKELGIEFFQSMPQNKNQQSRNWRGIYSNWAETPVKPSQRWSESKTTGRLDIYDYICAYGFCINIKPSVVEEANSIVNSTGSFYAYGRIGLIIVSPEKNLVMYFYNG